MRAERRRPDFLGIGAQRAATTWIHACLYEHPQIFMPAAKEVHFFSQCYSKGANWYEEQFDDCRPDRLAGEISPDYLYAPEAAERIRDWNPNVKLFACLRNPVDRAVSAYRYFINQGPIPQCQSFDDALAENPERLLGRGFYAAQLERFLKYFSREQILILIYEDIAADPYRFIQDIYCFLGVDSMFRPSKALRKINSSIGIAKYPSLYWLPRLLAAYFQKAKMGHLVWTVARSRLRELIDRLAVPQPINQPLSEARRAELIQSYAPDVRALEQLLQRDLRGVWFD